MKHGHLLAAIAAAFLFAAASPASAWEQIGAQEANGKRDRDEVRVRGNERHKQIRICVEKSPLRMRDLDVRFANGGNQDVQVRQRFEAGSCSRAIDLKGRRRNIEKVVLVYSDKGGDRPALVRIFAR